MSKDAAASTSTQGAFQSEIRAIVDAALSGKLDERGATRVYELGREATVAFVLAITTHAAARGAGTAPGPHTPSGAIPPYLKASASKGPGGQRPRSKKPGARDGHEGHHRPPPKVDRTQEVQDLKVCPDCKNPVLPARKRRRRTVEDMPQSTKVEAVEYVIPQHWCPCCQKHVEPGVAAALPNASIGNGIVALTTVFHYGLGLTIDQTREVLLSPLQTEVTPGGLVDLWRRTAQVLVPWYEEIGEEARGSATLHADETGWRVNGDTHWLWCFCNHQNCYYMIDESRGKEALNTFFTGAFKGVLIHDFWRPYEHVLLEEGGEHQCCLVHLLRELDHIDKDALPRKQPDQSEEWMRFVKMLRRLIKDGVRLRRRKDFTPVKYQSRIRCIDQRLMALAKASYADPDARRLGARLLHHADQIFTFLDRPEAAWENNFAERQVRPAVILRKNSQCNRSERGAATQAVLMSIYRTLKLRGHDPRAAIENALRAFSATGSLPPLPTRAVAVG